MVPEFVSCKGLKLTVSGYVAKFYIRTEPFSEAFFEKPNKEDEEPFGIVSERNFPHPYTLKTGEYECLVVERLRHTQEGKFVKDTVFGIVLDWKAAGKVAERRTFITVQSDVEFEKVKPVKRVVQLE